MFWVMQVTVRCLSHDAGKRVMVRSFCYQSVNDFLVVKVKIQISLRQYQKVQFRACYLEDARRKKCDIHSSLRFGRRMFSMVRDSACLGKAAMDMNI